MPVTTIAGSIDNFITLGAGGYASQLVVTDTGTVAPTFDAFATTSGYSFAVNLKASADLFTNDGRIVGDPVNPAAGYEAAGGGLYLSAGVAQNAGTIQGGSGSIQAGGVGVEVTGGTFTNLIEVYGGESSTRYGGGSGILLTGGTVVNFGFARGGGGGPDGAPGYGAVAAGGTFLNERTVDHAAVDGTGIFINDFVATDVVVSQTGTLLNGDYISDGIRVAGAGSFTNTGIVVGVTTDGAAPGQYGYGLTLDGTILAASQQRILNTGTITGVYGNAGGTLTDSGTILANGHGIAVYLRDGDARLVLEPGAAIDGQVIATPSFSYGQETIVNHSFVPVFVTDSNVIELAGSVAGSIDLGGSVSGFGTIAFDPDAVWTLGGTTAELAAGQAIAGFSPGDTLILEGFASATDTYVAGAGLVLSGAGGTATLDIAGSFTTAAFAVSTTGAATVIDLPCFASGTRILTPAGEVPVESLTIGGAVITAAGEERPIVWLGRRTVDVARHPRAETVAPIRIAAGAFADGIPARDLVLSPDHALLLDGCLVPVKALVNGRTVAALRRASVTYHHVELAQHDVIFAESLPVETYLDTGNRTAFEGAAAIALHPTFGADAQARRAAESCAPFTEAGPVVEAARRRLARRIAHRAAAG